MSSLADFVNEQRNKSRPTFSMANIGTKVSSSFSGFFLRADPGDDTERLTDEPAQNGQLPNTKNR